ncbi:glycine cleavage T C-terminal barrel domain-containing protein, partial [Klebsiella aerogenes]|uniref:glycine cleavage T C-terminal barrel domain-containing protein n=1 Tax=Klebsiella aerogenes TaxID=548 RepID=UPI0027D1F7EF
LLLIAVAIVAPWIAPYDAENYFDYDRLNEGPSLVHWFGVDSLGRDIFSRVLVGAQISLAAGVLAVLIGAAIGTVTSGGFGPTVNGPVAMGYVNSRFAEPGTPVLLE